MSGARHLIGYIAHAVSITCRSATGNTLLLRPEIGFTLRRRTDPADCADIDRGAPDVRINQIVDIGEELSARFAANAVTWRERA